jgi:hypothetical protein
MQGQDILPQKQAEAATETRREGTSITSLVLVVGVLLAIAAFFVITTAPLEQLLGESSYAAIAAFHGLSAGVMMVVVTIGLYLAYQLFMGQIVNLRDLKLLSVVNATMAFITIVFGNWIYVGYRAKGSVREWLLANNPEAHKIFFEFKEYMALFTLPLAVLAAYLLIRYDMALFERRWLRVTVAVILALTFFYFTVAFGLGAAITKIKPV